MKKSIWIVCALLVSLAVLSTRLPAQAPQSADVNAALIRELHDLRVAIEKLANANSRVQILASRANQQEQRINNLTDQLNVLNGKLVESSAQIARMNSQIEHAKDSVRVETDPDRRQGFQQELQALTYMLEEKGSAQSAVQMQAEAIRQQIIREQSNLSDTQRLLDELAR